MRIGYDAKRIFHNRSGLGNYGRTSLRILPKFYPLNEYHLYTPSPNKELWPGEQKGMPVHVPKRPIDRLFKDYWRAFSMTKQIAQDNLDIFHGLNNELPQGIHKTDVKTVMTVHDLIFLRYPHYYKYIDRTVYRIKSHYSVGIADQIIADTEQTKKDLIHFFSVPAEKIEVIYLSCNPLYYTLVDKEHQAKVKAKYNLPETYILCVGTIEERKNLLSVVKALHQGNIDVPLVAVGRATPYLKNIKEYCATHNLSDRVFFLHHVETIDLPALYQGAQLVTFISFFEGFGFPILEALYSKVPVISSIDGCFSEVGGKSSLYVDPKSVEEIIEAIQRVLQDSSLRQKMITDGYAHAQNFNEDVIAHKMMALYEKVHSS